MEAGGLKILDALLAGGGIGAAIGLGGLFIAWFFYAQFRKEAEKNDAIMEKRIEEQGNRLTTVTSAVERANTFMANGAAASEARDRTIQQVISILQMTGTQNDERVKMIMQALDRIEKQTSARGA